MTHLTDPAAPTAITFADGSTQKLAAMLGTKLDLREDKHVTLSMPSIRAYMAGLASAAADTYMTYALVGHESPAPWSALGDQAKVIAGEYDELQTAVAERDVKELRDGVGDLLYTVIGMAYRAGIPLVEDFEQVVRSNLTKFDVSLPEAENTKAKYEALGVKTYCQPVFFTSGDRSPIRYYITFADGDQIGTDGKKYPNHKWLKSIKFIDIDLPPMSSSHLLELTGSKHVEAMFAEAKATLLPSDDDQAASDTLYRLLLELIAGLLFLTGPQNREANTVSDAVVPASQAILAVLFRLSPDEAARCSVSHFDSQAFTTFVQYVTAQAPDPSKAFYVVMAARIDRYALGLRSCFMNMHDAMRDNEPMRVKLLEALYDAAVPYYGITHGVSWDAIARNEPVTHSADDGARLMGALKHLLAFLTGG